MVAACRFLRSEAQGVSAVRVGSCVGHGLSLGPLGVFSATMGRAYRKTNSSLPGSKVEA